MADQPEERRRPALTVFLSWSGDRSKGLAQALKDWLPTVVQGCDPWLSDDKIGAGERWHGELSKGLETTDFGIICVTRDNAYAPWVLFESGALSKRYNTANARVVPYFLDDSVPSKHPLAIYQGKAATSEGTAKLVDAMWDACGGWLGPRGRQLRDDLFQQRWPTLEREIQRLREQVEKSGVNGWKAWAPQPSQQAVQELNRLRQDIIRQATVALGTALSRSAGEVRANVYLIDIAKARTGIVELRMDEDLRPKKKSKENAIAFRQQQGLTGHSFHHKSPFAAWGSSPPGGEDWILTGFDNGFDDVWEPALNIGQAKVDLLEKKMRWILSIPLLDETDSDAWPLGIFNVDGFDELPADRSRTETILKAVEKAVASDVAQFARRLRKENCKRLRLVIE